MPRILLVTGTYDKKWGTRGLNIRQLRKVCLRAKTLESEIVVFSLFTYCTYYRKPFDPTLFFSECPHLKMIVLETGNLYEEKNLFMEIHRRNKPMVKFKRYFACGSDPRNSKEGLIKESSSGMRTIDGITFIYCGEVNILRYSRTKKRLHDDFGFLKCIGDSKVIINPFHTCPKRYEIPLKQKFLSKDGRLVLSLWNKMDRPEKGQPTISFYDNALASCPDHLHIS